MRRLSFRWQQVLPRLLAVMVALLGLQYALDLAARRLAVRSTEAALEANVEVARCRLSLLDRQLLLRELRVANPCRPAQELLQADRCELDFALGPLFHKRTVVDHGRVTGLRVAVEKSANTAEAAAPNAATIDQWLAKDADDAAREWLAQLTERFEQEPARRFEFEQRAEALCARWPVEWAALRERGKELERQAVDLQQATEAAEANRLRHAEFFRELPDKVAALQQEFYVFGTEVDELPTSLQAQRRAIAAAQEQDERLLRERLHLDPVEADSLTAYLLRDQLAGPLDELVGWLRWTRRVAPAVPAAAVRQARGEKAVFAGSRPGPNFLIRALQLQGTAQLGGQAVDFDGLLSDVADQPSRHDAPMRLRLTSSGPTPVDLQATIDRTGQVARDAVLVDCRRVALPELRLGRSGGLEMKLAPSVGSLSISALVEGDTLRGDIQLVQKDVRITPVLQGESSGARLAAPMQEVLGGTKSVVTRVALQGTLERPSCTLWSNLGPAVAEAMEYALHKVGDEHARAALANARRQVDERLAELERQFVDEQSKLASRWRELNGQLEAIAGRQTPNGRISAERLGRQLPERSHFR